MQQDNTSAISLSNHEHPELNLDELPLPENYTAPEFRVMKQEIPSGYLGGHSHSNLDDEAISLSEPLVYTAWVRPGR
jgi:hypothetical protein